jgi:hypothetical protein
LRQRRAGDAEHQRGCAAASQDRFYEYGHIIPILKAAVKFVVDEFGKRLPSASDGPISIRRMDRPP